ncbi:hypothetical protein ERJ75_000695700 [Trypanosoma vivax]|nr:hypothetical protein ERJ75_000695700 [Trypanosoma vivax]
MVWCERAAWEVVDSLREGERARALADGAVRVGNMELWTVPRRRRKGTATHCRVQMGCRAGAHATLNEAGNAHDAAGEERNTSLRGEKADARGCVD